ncbi:MAG TPA: penicillin-binding transpeptidase domain-containing protein [Flavipsychrobacter sp.]|nr:penicillin-binding transpeptidase domain-containing protein [Flavipsychrobacter sp.]
MHKRFLHYPLFIAIIALLQSCAQSRIHDQEDLGQLFKANGIQDGCFILRDHTHEEVFYYNKERCLKRFAPASTFKIFNSLVGLETAIAPDEQLVIKWDSVNRWNSEWNRDMTMREAFKVSNVGYYQELARRIGKDYLQHYLDTVQYGNKNMRGKMDEFWLNDTLQISADEQLGFVKKLYFDELPFSERSQRIVRSMMLREDTADYKLYYKTGTYLANDTMLCWVVGFVENIVAMKEHDKSMNKGGVRTYPYFFAMNFTVPDDKSKNWFDVRLKLLHEILNKMVFTKK